MRGRPRCRRLGATLPHFMRRGSAPRGPRSNDQPGGCGPRRAPRPARAERDRNRAHARAAQRDPSVHRQAEGARRRRRRADVSRGAPCERHARGRGGPALRAGRDARQRARPGRRVLPRAADHRGLMLTEKTIHELTAAYRSGETTPTAVAEAYLARIAKLDREVGAYLMVTGELALEAAAGAAARYRAGAPRSALDGVPVALKDILCTRGVPTTCGSKILESFVPPYDATVVERLRAAGAVLLGKTNMDEFAMGSSTEHSAFKLTRNPWGQARGPGGSAGGSAAALARGLGLAAPRPHTGGSARQPAPLSGAGRPQP